MHPSAYKRPLLWALAFVILLLVFFYRPAPGPEDVSRFIFPQSVTLEGRVESFAVPKKDDRNAVIQVLRVNGEPVSGRVYARVKNAEPLWKDTVRLEGKLKKPYNVSLLGNFAWGDYLGLKGVFAEIRSDGLEVVKPAAWPYRCIRFVRRDILNAFDAAFGPELSGIAGGVLLGERGETDPALYGAFQDSGAIHLLVASGGNVGFVTLMVFAFCSLFGAGRRRTALLALAVAGVYTLVAGADAPLVRAYFMAACACAGYLLNRNSGVFQGLVLSCLIILLGHPAGVFETGFQMSFLATLAIIVCLSNWQPPKAWPKAARFFAQIFLATLSTQLALLPVFTNVFYKVSVTGLASNMILVPLASALMGLGFAFYALSLVKLGFLLKGVLWCALWLFKTLVVFFASFKFSSLPAASWPAGYVAAYYVALFWVFQAPRRAFAKKILPYCAGLCGVLILGQALLFSPTRAWLLREWNESAVLVRTCRGETFLFGAGLYGEKLSRAILKSGSRKIDAVFLSSAAPKAEKGLKELETLLPVGRVVRPFADGAWPGDEFVFGKTAVTAEWGLRLRKDGGTWRSRGYAGVKEDALSYRICACGKAFSVGAGNRFALTSGGAVQNVRNGTVSIRI